MLSVWAACSRSRDAKICALAVLNAVLPARRLMAYGLLSRCCDHGNEENAMSRHPVSKAARVLAPQRPERCGSPWRSRDRIRCRRLPDGLGAKYQRRGAATRRRAGDGNSANCGASDEGSGLHRTDAGVGASRSPKSLLVAIQRDRLRRCQLCLHALPGRTRCAAGDSTREGQALGKALQLFAKGQYPEGRKAPQQGITPTMFLYATGPDGQKVTTGDPTEWLIGVPTLTNANSWGSAPI